MPYLLQTIYFHKGAQNNPISDNSKQRGNLQLPMYKIILDDHFTLLCFICEDI